LLGEREEGNESGEANLRINQSKTLNIIFDLC